MPTKPPLARAQDVDRDPSTVTLAPAVTRAAAILGALADAPSPVALSDLARRLGLPKSSVANICMALLDAGLIRRAAYGFGLGRRLAELGGAYIAAVDEVQEFYDSVERLPVASQETAQLALLDGLEMTYLARHDGRQPVSVASEIGRRLPASCTAPGKAALASLDRTDLAARLRGVESLPALTTKSHRRVADLLDDLEEVRRRGHAVDDEETAEGVVGIGVAIPQPRAAHGPHGVSVTILKARAEPARVEALVADLKRLASGLGNPLLPRLSNRA
ncbi:MAG TPA: IclR family transcriptional regulator [Candidatus Limnocylindrales bacterium]|nr:IclR family transcriptional regulator [Candidatus Limnocylindrales bacterium]